MTKEKTPAMRRARIMDLMAEAVREMDRLIEDGETPNRLRARDALAAARRAFMNRDITWQGER